jgi:predicted NAD-dependent protein-ADP-ribosyltransferase YbiA (DUF1768 family)
MITAFQGEHRWLSNFWPAQVELDKVIYPSVEHAYQAAKSIDDKGQREPFQWGTAGDAKRRGRKLKVRRGWDGMKVQIMQDLIRQKFAPGTALAVYIVEGNTWGDTFWGVCRGVGENHLGRLLMEQRDELKGEQA